jgi:predicted Zn-ribbon and HTH transcriptional regulator
MGSMILEKEVWVGLGGNNKKYFENLGYELPRVKNKKGKLVIPNGTEILVQVIDLPEHSGVNVTKICDDCGKYIPNQPYYAILSGRDKIDTKDRCVECSQKYKGIIAKENIIYENSLDYFAIKNNKEYLLNEFSIKNSKSPIEISRGTKDEYIWNCPNCKSEYVTSVYSRTGMNTGCSYCSGKEVNETNSLWTTHPEIAKFLDDPERGNHISAGSNKKELFRCNQCGNAGLKVVANVVKLGYSCPKCGDGISYPEKFMTSILDQVNIYYEKQKTFKWSNKKIYDFYIPSLNCIIEVHGEQHYESKFDQIGGRSIKEEQENDSYKEKIALNNNISNYIVIDCRKSDLNFIKNNIIESEFSRLCKLDNINWEKCDIFATNSLVKVVSDLWNGGIKSTAEIAKKVNLDKGTVYRYLMKGKKINWCNYNPKEVKINKATKMGERNKRKIIQLTLNNNYIKEWIGMIDVEKNLGISSKNISKVCSGKGKTAGGYKWMYLEDYEKQLSETI